MLGDTNESAGSKFDALKWLKKELQFDGYGVVLKEVPSFLHKEEDNSETLLPAGVLISMNRIRDNWSFVERFKGVKIAMGAADPKRLDKALKGFAKSLQVEDAEIIPTPQGIYLGRGTLERMGKSYEEQTERFYKISDETGYGGGSVFASAARHEEFQAALEGTEKHLHQDRLRRDSIRIAAKFGVS